LSKPLALLSEQAKGAGEEPTVSSYTRVKKIASTQAISVKGALRHRDSFFSGERKKSRMVKLCGADL
jgi:hypothetical protein